MINRIIIFGGHVQALGLARQAKREDIEVDIVIEDKWSVARFSSSVDNYLICKSTDEIDSVIIPYEDTGTLLFPTSDEYVEYLTARYSSLSKHFTIGIPGPECTNIFLEKRNTYKFCERNNIPHPASFYPESIDDVAEISKQASFPLVVKPGTMYSFHKLVGKKAFLCHSSEDLISKCLDIQQKGFPVNDLIIQEFLSGGPESLYSYGAFAVMGEPKAWIQANRVRQNPMDFGNSTTYAISCNIAEIEETAKRILKLTNYSGLAEIEFMYDAESGQYKFLEVNTRAWKWHTLSNAFGFGFLSEMIRYYNSLESEFISPDEKMSWVERITDFSIIAKECLRGRMNPIKAFSTYKIKKTYAVWSWKDPLPAIMYLLMTPVLFVKRY